MKADLHIHTCASDGNWTPAELIAEAQKVGLGALAVTDHDTGEYYGIGVLCATNKEPHILATENRKFL